MRTVLRGITAIVFLVLIVIGVVACREERSGTSAGGDAIPTSPDGSSGGALFGMNSSQAVVLIADDQQTDVWAPLAEELGRLGYRVLVLPRPAQDGGSAVRAAADRLLREGAEQVVYVGSRRGVDAALAAAAGGAAGLVLLNPEGAGDAVPPTGIPPVALLIMASLVDGPSSATAQQIYHAAREPRTLALYLSSDAVPAAFAGESNELRTAFLDFLRHAFQPLNA